MIYVASTEYIAENDVTPNWASCQMSFDPFLFVDLDGTIRGPKEGEFIDGPNDLEILAGRKEALRAYSDGGYHIVAVTNQGGVACGHKTAEQVEAENERTNEYLDGLIESFYMCPCHPKGEGRLGHQTFFRKPFPGMIVKAELDYRRQGIAIDMYRSLMIGDRNEDRLCAKKLNLAYFSAGWFFGDRVEKTDFVGWKDSLNEQYKP